ncbi:MAG TPA: hypothetical protein VKF14_14490 [Candidatus Dormibacteraeota bacterium]|nr:hypothetical protein [Candidatus Dormibacteraeota bacterium]
MECGGELGVTIPEKELGRESTVLESPGQIASLLHHPLRARVVGAAGEVNATAADLNKEEDVELGHPDGVDHKEVTGEHLVGMLAYEGSPGALTAPRRWAEAMAAEDPDHGQVRAAHDELEQLTLGCGDIPSEGSPQQGERWSRGGRVDRWVAGGAASIGSRPSAGGPVRDAIAAGSPGWGTEMTRREMAGGG